MDNLEWLGKLITDLPRIKNNRKSIYEITGFPHWENVNSNILAFYFDENGEHGFGRLFIQALLNLMTSKKIINNKGEDGYATEFSVEREVPAGTKWIDLVIKSKQEESGKAAWAIIIENKINAPLYNDLKLYYESVEAEIKHSIVLWPKHKPDVLNAYRKDSDIKYHSITHQELITAVKNNLANHFTTTDDRHLLLLKEYFLNFENMTNQLENPALELQINLLQQNAANIEALKTAELSVNDYVARNFVCVMDSFGFFVKGSFSIKQSKHFYSKPIEDAETFVSQIPYFRFYIWLPNLSLNREVNFHFELFGVYVKYAEGLRKYLQVNHSALLQPPLSIGVDGGDNDGYAHIINVKGFKLPKDANKTFAQILTAFFESTLFNEQNSLVNICAAWMQEHYEEEKVPIDQADVDK